MKNTTQANLTISEELARPLRKGFDAVHVFLHEYIRADRHEAISTPDLGLSLGHIEHIGNIGELVSEVREKPLCLIEGCTSPTNGQALAQFMARQNKPDATVHAIDLIDVKSIFDGYGITMIDTDFFVADACDLRDNYKNNSVDVIAQDFLLNCAPFDSHKPIMQEANRIMHPQGIALICFTDHNALMSAEELTYSQLETEFGLTYDQSAFCLRDLLPENHSDADFEDYFNALNTKVLVDDTKTRYALITKDGGNFEFFRPFSAVHKLFDDTGFRIVGLERSSGKDRNGIVCVRYRAVLKTDYNEL